MRSGKWCFSVPLFKKNVQRFWPIWGLYILVNLFMLPVFYMSGNYEWSDLSAFTYLNDYTMGLATVPAIPLLYGLVVACALWNYLFSERATGAMHTLPLRRESIFLTNYITGLLFFLVPSLLVVLLTLCAGAAVGAVTVHALGYWLLCQGLMMVFFFSLATLLAFVTGHMVVQPVLYIIFNGLCAGIVYLLSNVFRLFVYGYSGAVAMENLGIWGTPLLAIFSEVNPMYSVRYGDPEREMLGMSCLWIYAAVGLLLAVLALLLYRSRKLELAGEVIVVPWLRPLFKYSVAACGALLMSTVFFAALELTGIMLFSVLLVFFGALFYFAAEMLLQKSFHVFRRSWRGCCVLAAALLLGVVVMENDMLAYERRVPSLDQVQSARVNGTVNSPSIAMQTDPEYQEQIITLHQAMVREKQTQERLGEKNDADWYGWIIINYTLQDGSTLDRQYKLYADEEQADWEGSAAWALQEIEKRWHVESLFPEAYTQEKHLQRIEVENYITRVDGKDDSYWEIATLTAEGAVQLYRALRADAEAGNLGMYMYGHAPMGNQETALTESERWMNASVSLYFGNRSYEESYSVRLDLTPTAENTLRALDDLGIAYTIWEADGDESRPVNNNTFVEGIEASEETLTAPVSTEVRPGF